MSILFIQCCVVFNVLHGMHVDTVNIQIILTMYLVEHMVWVSVHKSRCKLLSTWGRKDSWLHFPASKHER